jgi:hypothetical protein
MYFGNLKTTVVQSNLKVGGGRREGEKEGEI